MATNNNKKATKGVSNRPSRTIGVSNTSRNSTGSVKRNKPQKENSFARGGTLKRKLQIGGKTNANGTTSQNDTTTVDRTGWYVPRGYTSPMPKEEADAINLAVEQQDYDRTGKLTNPNRYGTITKNGKTTVVPLKQVLDIRSKIKKQQEEAKKTTQSKSHAQGGSLRKPSKKAK